MSAISRTSEEGSIVSKFRTTVLLGCRGKVMFSRIVTKCCGILLVVFDTPSESTTF